MERMWEGLAAGVALVTARPAFGLSTTELLIGVEAVEVLSAQLAAVSAAYLRELDGRGFAGAQGASSLLVWLRERTRLSIREARRRVELGQLLDQRPEIAAAMTSGALTLEQALAIGKALDDLPDDLDPGIRDEAAAALLAKAAECDPVALARLGRRILDLVAPEVAEEELRRQLDREEARARIRRTFTVGKPVGGTARVSGYLDVESAAIVEAALEPWARPHRGDDGPDLRSPGQRRADALAEVCALSLRTGELPESGGEPPQVTVTMRLESLRAGVGAGTLDTSEPLSASAVRRIACEAKVIPAVLGGNGAVLDIGRTQRLFTGPLRRAVVLRDGGCAFPGCDRPPRWCVCHHILHWCDGGPTSLSNAVLLCGHHHRVVHRDDWQVRLGRDGLPEFVPPSYVDPHRTPRRNHHHGRSGGLAPGDAAGRPRYPRRT